MTIVSISIVTIDHCYADRVSQFPDTVDFSIGDIVDRIVRLNDGLRQFWRDSTGWAPIESAELMSKSRLDWQVDLSDCLRIWIGDCSSDGRLILAWTNLGSLVEGTMKLFLAVYYETYRADADAIYRRGKVEEPDGLELEKLRRFFEKRIWDSKWNDWVRAVQRRRNAIHAFRDRDIGDIEEYQSHLRTYLKLVRYVNARLPYPSVECVPREV